MRKVLGKTEWYQPKFREGGEDGCGEGEEPVAPKSWRSHNRVGIRRREHKSKKSPYEAVVFVPCTPGAKLKRAMQAADDKFTKTQKIKSVKFVEQGGTAIAEMLVKSNPFKLTHCGREGCWPCNGPMSIPSDKPVTQPVVTSNNVPVTSNNVQVSSFVHISLEVEEEGQGEVGSREGGREGASRRDTEEACDVAGAAALHTLANCLCRSSPEEVVAQEHHRLLQYLDDLLPLDLLPCFLLLLFLLPPPPEKYVQKMTLAHYYWLLARYYWLLLVGLLACQMVLTLVHCRASNLPVHSELT
jgi:hypothetical protein